MQRAIGVLVACLVIAGAAASGASPPVPPRRPVGLQPPGTRAQPRTDETRRNFVERDLAGEAPEACLTRLRESGVDYEPLARQEDGACIIASPVRLHRLAASGTVENAISFAEPPLIDCRLAERLAEWLRDVVSPLFRARLGASLRAVATGAGYECRTRNRDPDAKLSAHGLGLALDISAFDLADKRRLRIGAEDDGDALAVIRKSACGWFTTVLGPGSPDNLHQTHLHIDMQPHGSGEGYKICQ